MKRRMAPSPPPKTKAGADRPAASAETDDIDALKAKLDAD